MRNGFVISFDALAALLIFLVLLATATAYLAKAEFKAGSSLSLKETAMDCLAVLEESGKLEKAVSSDRSNELRGFLNTLPYSICADLRVYSQNDLNTPALLVLRPGCRQNFRESATIQRSIVVESAPNPLFYIAELRAWYRVAE